MARWVRGAEKVVLIDGCFLRCHGRMIESLLDDDQLVEFDALSVCRDYTDLFDIDALPEVECSQAAKMVADSALAAMGT